MDRLLSYEEKEGEQQKRKTHVTEERKGKGKKKRRARERERRREREREREGGSRRTKDDQGERGTTGTRGMRDKSVGIAGMKEDLRELGSLVGALTSAWRGAGLSSTENQKNQGTGGGAGMGMGMLFDHEEAANMAAGAAGAVDAKSELTSDNHDSEINLLLESLETMSMKTYSAMENQTSSSVRKDLQELYTEISQGILGLKKQAENKTSSLVTKLPEIDSTRKVLMWKIAVERGIKMQQLEWVDFGGNNKDSSKAVESQTCESNQACVTDRANSCASDRRYSIVSVPTHSHSSSFVILDNEIAC